MFDESNLCRLSRWDCLFLIMFFSATIIYGMQTLGLSIPLWINSYMNDFMCLPLVLYICRYFARLCKSDDTLQLPIGPILVLTLFYTLYFEYYLPEVHFRYTHDPYDILLYFLGSGFFMAIQFLEVKGTAYREEKV